MIASEQAGNARDSMAWFRIANALRKRSCCASTLRTRKEKPKRELEEAVKNKDSLARGEFGLVADCGSGFWPSVCNPAALFLVDTPFVRSLRIKDLEIESRLDL